MRVRVKIDHDAMKLDVLHHALDDHRPVEAALPVAAAGGALLARLHDENGNVLREVSFPVRSHSYFDRPEGDRFKGKVVALATDVRDLDITTTEDLAFVSLERRWSSNLQPDASTLLHILCVGAPTLPDKWKEVDKSRIYHLKPPEEKAPPEAFAGMARLHEAGKPERCYNIVILGDGFQRGEQPVFLERAQTLADGLLKSQPFKSLADRINLRAVQMISDDSGVTDCPFPDPLARPRGPSVRKDTYFGVQGNFADSGSASYFGTERHDRLGEAAGLSGIRLGFVDLTIVLVNTILPGGRGDPATRTVYMPVMVDDARFVAVAVHECGHAIAELADEYIGGDPPLDGRRYPNVATELDRIQGSAPWSHLAFPFERDGTSFRAVHRLGDPIDPSTKRPVMAPGLGGMLGLFWGCAFIDPAPAAGIDGADDNYTDARGGSFYRPMALCKMRWNNQPFCRVCERALRDKIDEILRSRA